MGFFDFLRRKNKIVIDFDISTEPVFVYPTNKIKLPMQAVVPKDCVLFLTDGDKILDSFTEGEHELSLANLPKCDKRFKLSKPNKDGKFQKYFFCDVYIVNKILFKYKPFKCYRKAEIFDKNVGEFKVSISGGYAFQIANAQKFLQNLLCEYNHLKNKEAEKILSGYVGEFVLGEIEKSKFGIEDFLYTDHLVDFLYERIGNKLDFLGVEFLGFDIKECKLPKRLRLISQNIANQTQIGKNIFVQKDLENTKTQNSWTNEKSNQIVQNTDPTEQELLHFGNRKNKCIDVENQYLHNDEDVDYQTKKYKKNENFASKSVDNQTGLNYDSCTVVRCLFCGYENSAQNQNCALCGQPLKRKGRL